MRRILEKMAQQLNSYDEASLMQLWQEYASKVQAFEPSRRWEEAALALCLIQAVHWKNKLFNYQLVLTAAPPEKTPSGSPPVFGGKPVDPPAPSIVRHRATILPFPTRNRPDAEQKQGGKGQK